MNTLQLSSELASNLPECEVGDIKRLTVTGEVTAKNPDGSLTLNVTNVNYEAGNEPGEEQTETGAEEYRRKKPTAVMIMMGGKAK